MTRRAVLFWTISKQLTMPKPFQVQSSTKKHEVCCITMMGHRRQPETLVLLHSTICSIRPKNNANSQ